MPVRSCRVAPRSTSLTVLEALRRHADACRRRFVVDPRQEHVLRRMFRCRTAALGAHLCVCEACGWRAPAYNSCRDRHCPQCQGAATAEWLEKRQAQMLPVPHFQAVFTLPATLRPLARANPQLVYATMMRASASVLQDLAAQRMHARLGLTSVLHTWTTDLLYHPHVHVLVTAGGLHADGDRWVPTRPDYLFPGRVMGAMFRGRVLEALLDALADGTLVLPANQDVASLRRALREVAKAHRRWVVHVEPPNGRPVAHVARYLARYVKRVAISDARIVDVCDTEVAFKSRQGVVRLSGAEFVRRFLLHVLPPGFRKIRHYGLYASGARARLEAARALLAPASSPAPDETDEPAEDEVVDEDEALKPCPQCGAAAVRRMHPSSRRWQACLEQVRTRGLAQARGPP